ncbi:MAG: Spy/CpxP family protein refolding chaperone [Magnetospirillum sp. WYHS-4]
MKLPSAKSLLSIAALSAIVAGGAMLPREAAAGSPNAAACEKSGGKHGDFRKSMDKRLDILHRDLKLSAEQETAWTEWSGKVKSTLDDAAKRRPDYQAMTTLPAPERFEKLIEMGKERQTRREADLVALKAFYAKLTPDQQKIFDKGMPFGPDHRKDGKTPAKK